MKQFFLQKSKFKAWTLSSKDMPTHAQKMKYSIKNFFSKYEQIRRKLRICSHLLKKFVMENFIFCAIPSGVNQP